MGTGNTFNSPAGTRTHSVHPRGHGEHFSEKAVFAFVYGSSPWARGTPSIMPNLLSFERFIPVGTGNTPQRSKCVILPSVHPRGHGEHDFMLVMFRAKPGSSPWARGTRVYLVIPTHSKRFIPVGTGNTLIRQRQSLRLAVHPRGHGEHKYTVYW